MKLKTMSNKLKGVIPKFKCLRFARHEGRNTGGQRNINDLANTDEQPKTDEQAKIDELLENNDQPKNNAQCNTDGQCDGVRCPFLSKLPPEIRNIIYTLAVVADDYVSLNQVAQVRDLTALTRVCSQIRKEASSIFFTENKFHIDLKVISEPNKVLDWLSSIGKECASKIKNLKICFDTDIVKEWVKGLNPTNHGEGLAHIQKVTKPATEGVTSLAEKILACGVHRKSVHACLECKCSPKALEESLKSGLESDVLDCGVRGIGYAYLAIAFESALDGKPIVPEELVNERDKGNADEAEEGEEEEDDDDDDDDDDEPEVDENGCPVS